MPPLLTLFVRLLRSFGDIAAREYCSEKLDLLRGGHRRERYGRSASHHDYIAPEHLELAVEAPGFGEQNS